MDTTRERGCGRAQTRTVNAIDLTGNTDFADVAQAVRVRRHLADKRTGKPSWTGSYEVTSLEAGQADAAGSALWCAGMGTSRPGTTSRTPRWGRTPARSAQAEPRKLAVLGAMAIVLWSGLGQDCARRDPVGFS